MRAAVGSFILAVSFLEALSSGLLASTSRQEPSDPAGAPGAVGARQAPDPAGDDGFLGPTDPRLYVIGTAHLDTQWRWTVRETINDFLPATLRDNFALFQKYPDYVFSFEGAFHYMLIKEYYPEEYRRLRDYIARGRWRVAGSWVDAVDTNMPSPESLIRQTLYGNGFFRREFGMTSRDVFLPDCFGFGYALPSLAAHCGLEGFSTQKLSWGSAYGVPFDIGLWRGVDGSSLVAALRPEAYVSHITGDLSADSAWIATIDAQGRRSGLYAGFKYFGTGDQGGAPPEESVAWLEKSIHGGGPLHVESAASDRLARDVMGRLSPEQRAALPLYDGELLMTRHGAGCYTSEAAMKRWNRKNERMAGAAEPAAVVADWLGGSAYPRDTLREAWVRFLWHQFHDDLTGTSIPEAYEISWNDEAIAMNQFSGILEDAAGAVIRALDTRVGGVPVVVYNPLGILRQDAVEAEVEFPDWAPATVRVYNQRGREVPSQVLGAEGNTTRILFLAEVPSVSFAVYDVRPSASAPPIPAGVAVSAERSVRSSPESEDESSERPDSAGPVAAGGGLLLENLRYRLHLDGDGNIAQIDDKRAGRGLLSAPLALQLLTDSPKNWASWEIDYDDLMAAPRTVVGGPARVRVLERGPVRASVEIAREADGSRFVQVVSLCAGEAGDRVTIENTIDWGTKGTLLKAAFPLSVANKKATYDLGLGTIARGTNREQLYEVPGQQWADLTDAGGAYGVAVLNDCRYGWDKPDDHTLRLTLIHTPEVNDNWSWIADQRSMDLGRHHVTFALCGHEGDWNEGNVVEQGDRLNQPLRAFCAVPHAGPLGREFSLVKVGSSQPGSGGSPVGPRGLEQVAEGHRGSPVAIRAVKLAEESDEIVVRLEETAGRPADVRLEFAAPIATAREVNGAEEPIGPIPVERNGLDLSFGRYQPRTFAVRLAEPPARIEPPTSVPVALPYNLDGISLDSDRKDGDIDGAGNSLAGELLPPIVVGNGIRFRIGPKEPGALNVLACRGQSISLPPGGFNRLYLLAASAGGDRDARLLLDGRPVDLRIQDYAEPIGSWCSRLQGGELVEDPARIVPAYLKEGRVGWVGTHRHSAQGENEAYVLTCFFRYRVDLPPGGSGGHTLTLPADDSIRILAMTAAWNENDASPPARKLIEGPEVSSVRIEAPKRSFLESEEVTLRSPNPGAVLRYTLDGTDPGPGSAVYNGRPIVLRSSATLKARASVPDLEDHYVAEAVFTKMVPRDPDPAPAALQPGLRCRYYEGGWQRLPGFAALTPVREAVLPQVSLPDFARPENYALALDGYFVAPRDGLYTFHLWSDDGSALYLGKGAAKVIDNDGMHGRAEKTADVALKAGRHAIRVEYLQGPGDAALELWIEGPGWELKPAPAEAFGHEAGLIGLGG